METLNKYGNKAGYHTPEKTVELMTKINRQVKGIRFTDTSWHNDLCDSIWNEKRDIQVYFPNSDNNDPENEEFNHFGVVINREKSYEDKRFQETWKNFQTIGEVIHILTFYVRMYDKDKLEAQKFFIEFPDMFTKK